MERVTAVEAGRRAHVGQTVAALFKVRVVGLLLFAAVGGACLAAAGRPGLDRLALLVATGGLAAGGASALNEYLEVKADARMERTRDRRPLVSGAIAHPGWVPFVATAMIVGPALAVVGFEPALALWLLVGAAIYIGVYTIWLKPRTPLNIVIGGAAGSAAVLSGAAAAGAWSAPSALVLALLVFLWTPTHFWSLAIAHREDYGQGGFPMLPNRTTPRAAAWWVMLHTGGTVVAALALGLIAGVGWLYAAPVGLATLELVRRNACLIAHPHAGRARALFIASNAYLAIVVLMGILDLAV